jgi:hypothetical protein
VRPLLPRAPTSSSSLSSLHLQPPSDDLQQVVAHALFADAAAAVAVAPGRPGLEVIDIVSRTDTARASEMTWDVTDHGFRMGLSPRVPAGSHGLCIDQFAAWAVHAGGLRHRDGRTRADNRLVTTLSARARAAVGSSKHDRSSPRRDEGLPRCSQGQLLDTRPRHGKNR